MSDLKERAAKKKPKKGGQQLVKCDAELWAVLERFKKRHGKEAAVEVIRRSMKAGLLFAEEELKPGTSGKESTGRDQS